MENDQAASLPVSSSSSSSPRRRPLAESFTPSAKKLPSISRVCTPQGQETFSATDCVFAEKRRQEKPFFLKVFQIRPGSYRFNTIVRIVSQEISSLLSLPASSFSSSSGLPYSCKQDNWKRKLKRSRAFEGQEEKNVLPLEVLALALFLSFSLSLRPCSAECWRLLRPRAPPDIQRGALQSIRRDTHTRMHAYLHTYTCIYILCVYIHMFTVMYMQGGLHL